MIELLWRGIWQDLAKLYLHLPLTQQTHYPSKLTKETLAKIKKIMHQAINCRILCGSKRIETTPRLLNRGLIE